MARVAGTKYNTTDYFSGRTINFADGSDGDNLGAAAVDAYAWLKGKNSGLDVAALNRLGSSKNPLGIDTGLLEGYPMATIGGTDYAISKDGNGGFTLRSGDIGVNGQSYILRVDANGNFVDGGSSQSNGGGWNDYRRGVGLYLGAVGAVAAAAYGLPALLAGSGSGAATGAAAAEGAAGATAAGGTAAAAGGAVEAGALGSGTYGLGASAGSSFGSLTGSTALTATTAGGVAGSSGLTLAEIAAGTTATSAGGGGLLAGAQEAISAVRPYYQAASNAASLYGQVQGALANRERADDLGNQVQNAQDVTNNLQAPTAPPVPAAQAATEQAYQGQDAYDAITTVLRRANARRGRGETDLTGGSLDFSSTRQAANTLLGS